MKRTKRTKRRYVYLMERVSQREWKSIRQGRREIKIGMSFDVKDRNRTVDLGIPGRVVIVDRFLCNNASQVERMVQKMYSKHNFHVKGAKKGAGGTEFYRLTNRDIRQAKRILRRKERWSMPVLMKIIILSLIIVAIIHYLK